MLQYLSMTQLQIKLLLLLTMFVGGVVGITSVIDVQNYGAKGDGSDATQAFKKAWEKACSSSVPMEFRVPVKKTYLLKPIILSGPCKSSITMNMMGTIVASSKLSDWEGDKKHWIQIKNVGNLLVEGGGTIDGNGDIWWKNSCKIDKSLPCTDAPTAITFYSCDNLNVKNMNVKDGQKMHVSFEKCSNVKVSGLKITAPTESPNTDGIHVTRTKNIQIKSSSIGTGDDCISIVGGSKDVTFTNITCGPGHGISIGSLGEDNSEEEVSDVVVDTATLDGTTNGVRIKTWQGGKGYAKNIAFRNIKMNKVKNPIIIDQNYCDSDIPCKQQNSAVAVSNVVYKNIKGTSASSVAIKFDCSKTVPCRGIILQDIDLSGGKSICNNVILASVLGKNVPTTCP